MVNGFTPINKCFKVKSKHYFFHVDIGDWYKVASHFVLYDLSLS